MDILLSKRKQKKLKLEERTTMKLKFTGFLSKLYHFEENSGNNKRASILRFWSMKQDPRVKLTEEETVRLYYNSLSVVHSTSVSLFYNTPSPAWYSEMPKTNRTAISSKVLVLQKD